MEVSRQVSIRLIEIFSVLAMGLFFTIYILKPFYENFGIPFHGNVWVNWFGVSYILFVLYTLAFSMVSSKNYFKMRLKSGFFWLVFIGSIFVVFLPFVKGENPF